MKVNPGFEKYLARVGVTPTARLEWVFHLLNRYRPQRGENWLSGDWDNLRSDLAVLCGIGDSLPHWGGVPLEHGEIIERPSQKEAPAIVASMLDMVDEAEHHKVLRLTPFPMRQELRWDAQAERYRLHEDWDDLDEASWLDRTRYALAHLLKDHGHRIHQCPAKLAHAGKRCANYFLKSKRQKYCSKTCTSREMTRAKRTRDAHNKKGGKSHGTKKHR